MDGLKSRARGRPRLRTPEERDQNQCDLDRQQPGFRTGQSSPLSSQADTEKQWESECRGGQHSQLGVWLLRPAKEHGRGTARHHGGQKNKRKPAGRHRHRMDHASQSIKRRPFMRRSRQPAVPAIVPRPGSIVNPLPYQSCG